MKLIDVQDNVKINLHRKRSRDLPVPVFTHLSPAPTPLPVLPKAYKRMHIFVYNSLGIAIQPYQLLVSAT